MLKTMGIEQYELAGELKYTASSLNDFRAGDDDRLIDFIFYGNSREALMHVVRDVMITQSLALGGKGGDRNDDVATQREEGLSSAAHASADSQADPT